MTTAKQLVANRRNAQQSTGPKTPEGKAVVSLNAMKHGLLSREVLLPEEDAAALGELGQRLHAHLQPVGALEALLMDRVVAAAWRLRRLLQVEAGLFTWEWYGALVEQAEREARAYERLELATLAALTTTITDKTKHQEALATVHTLKARQEMEPIPCSRAFLRQATGADAFAKLARYETTIERGLYKALQELQRLQAARAEPFVPPPAAVEGEGQVSPSRETDAA